MSEEKLIQCRNNIGFGMPTLKGRRLTVYDIVSKIDVEETLKDAIDDYEINLIEAKAAVIYCMNLECQKDVNRINYCDGCILKNLEENKTFNDEDYIYINENYTVSKDGLFTFLGSLKELKDERFGRPGFAIANAIFINQLS